jgi:hypothetical protein
MSVLAPEQDGKHMVGGSDSGWAFPLGAYGGIRDQGSENRDLGSEIRDQGPGIRGQKSEVKDQ